MPRKPTRADAVHVRRDDCGNAVGYVVFEDGKETDYRLDELFVLEAVAGMHDSRMRFYERLWRRRRLRASLPAPLRRPHLG